MNIRPVVALAVAILLAPGRSGAQTTEGWFDYVANWTPEGHWSYEVNPGFAKALSGGEWLDTYLAGSATYKPYSWFSTEGNLEAHYTFDETTQDLLEIRPWLGTNFIWPTFGTHWNLFYPMFGVRLEERLLSYQATGETSTKERLRLRLFARFTINNTILEQDTYYLLFLVEAYYPLDGEVREVSADRTRFQAGLGYVVAPELRVELQYLSMNTRNTESNKFETASHIIWLAVRSFF